MEPTIRDFEELRQHTTFAREPFFALAKQRYRPGMTVLDIGAGDGAFARFLGDPQIHLLEGNPQSAEALRQNYPHARCHRIPEPFPYEDRFFDLIHCSHLIEHLQPAELYALLKEIARCLKVGGVLVVSAPLMWSGFHNDLSHVRPYNPEVLFRYLCRGNAQNPTREVISSDFRVVDLKYRYHLERVPYWTATHSRASLHRWLFALAKWCRERWFGVYAANAYTLVLEKGNGVNSTEGAAPPAARD